MIKTHVKSIIGHHRSSAICKPEALRTSRMARARESDNTKCRRMWGKQNPHALLERRADGAAAAENSLAVPRRREQGDHLTQHFPLVLPRRREHTCPHVNLHTDIRTASRGGENPRARGLVSGRAEWCVHAVGYYRITTKNGTLIHASQG